MTAVTLPDGAPLCARHLAALMQALPDAERTLAPTSREFRAALSRVASRTPLIVMMTRSEVRTGAAYLRKVGVL